VSPEEAHGIIARELVSKVLLASVDYAAESWDDYPDVGENDWKVVVAEYEHLATLMEQTPPDLLQAYGVLSARAET